MQQSRPSSRSTNIIIRVTPEQRDLIDQAALLNNKTQTDFILEAATMAAQDSILDQVLLPVPVEQFEAFQRFLERSPEQDKRLSALMARTSRWGK
ncbi:MAG: DUF1778 domain-containing protein [Deltaproteobacteria bacterium]|nr:DUF1778 domain-containing protein [Deltaproteobacteria bacterium]